ncbi:MAG TPA: class I SAM-dependent methyltransferase [Polyangiaceae bacterium]|nr:class I SAM-dependent methyltransferase [Polyangiaceae bacterium]
MQRASSPAPGDDWNRHWDAYAATNALNPAQAYRRKLIFERLGLDGVSGAHVLELGTGPGELSSELATRFPNAELLGLDISRSGLAVAAQKVPSATFIEQDFMQPFTLPGRFSGWATHAICSEVLEHVEDPERVLANARRCLAPGARVVITVPAGPRSAFDRHIGHRRHFTVKSLSALITGAGLEVESLHAAGFPFFNLYRLVVVARGRKLIDDVDTKGPLPLTARLAMRAFSRLFELNHGAPRWGWQLVAVAREPEPRASSRGAELP